ncbi:MAG: hypothetical protein J6A45_07880, partial [Lachnospiraceae bacterium]|nr:hypothetical protein [Lachnospiraceae bacterium]
MHCIKVSVLVPFKAETGTISVAKIYEKAVQFPAGGSITIIAVTTLSGGDITHAVPDNTGYITEGQLFLRR